MNTLDQWEAEAKEYLAHFVGEEESRILALIDLVRKKDEALKAIDAWFEDMRKDQHEKLVLKQTFESACENWAKLTHGPFDMNVIKEALTLTEELK